MKIGLIVDTIDYGYSGASTYAYNLVKHLLEVDKSNKYILIHNKRSRCPAEFEDIFNKAEAEELTIKPPFGLKNKRVIEAFITKSKYPEVLEKSGLDIIHEVRGDDSLFPPSECLKLGSKSKLIVTVHDIDYFQQKLQFKNLKRSLYSYIVSSRLKGLLKSNLDFEVIAISLSTKNYLLKLFPKLNEERVHVIHHGIDTNLFRPKKVANKIPYTPFILYVGGMPPRKNIPNLIKAYYRIKKEGFPQRLLMVSNRNPEIDKLIKSLNLEEDILFESNISLDYLIDLYNSADLFVFPSLYEGFGFPVLEAMACGCPVVTSNKSSLPEITGKAGIKINPYIVNDIANAIGNVLSDNKLRKRMSNRSLERAKTFSWGNCAKKTLNMYNKVLAHETSL